MNQYKIFSALFLAFVLSSCSEERDPNVWLVGTSFDNAPYEELENGKPVGFDVDLIVEVARHLGKRVEFKNMEFKNLLMALTHENVDLVIAGMSVTPERLARVDFSIPYMKARIAVVYRRRDGFREAEDLKGKKVGAQLGTIWTLIAHDMASKYYFKTKSLSNSRNLISELRNKKLDAVIVEESQAENLVIKYPKLSTFPVHQYGSSLAIAMTRGSPHKRNIDHAIKALRSNGAIGAIARKWRIVGVE